MAGATIQNLLRAALEAQSNSYAPYSGFHVGAAIEADNGMIYAGCNVETATYKSTCAESSAISVMISAGGKKIKNILVIGPTEDECAPCGDCRQRILEFADSTTRIYTCTPSGKQMGVYSLNDLLPKSFGSENLKQVTK